jgi:hypothetical protein
MVSVGFASQTYTGSALTPVVNAVSPAAATYTTSAIAKTAAGTYTDSSVTGTTNYTGTVTGTFVVNRASLVSVGFASQTYTGGSLTPVVNAVSPAAATYTTSAIAKTNAGTYTDSGITGTTNYQGTVTGSFTINPASMVSVAWNTATYNGASQTATVSSTSPASATGTVGTAQTNAGTYSTSFTGSGNFTGAVSANWTINKASQATVTVSAASSMTYGTSSTWYGGGGSGTGQMYWNVPGYIGDTAATSAAITTQLNAGAYYTMRFYKAADGNYNQSNNADQSFYVNPASVTFSYSNTSKTYNGAAQSPTVTPSNGSATYSNGGTTSATNAGSYTITSSASGNYSGSGSSGWSIAKANQGTVSISGSTSGTAGNSYSYTASGGSGSGAYAFGGSGSGSTNPNSVYFGSPGSYSVTVYKATDTNYNQSNTASVGVTIAAPTEYIQAGSVGGFNNSSYIYVSWATQVVHSGSPIYFYINAYATDGGNVEWTDPYYLFWAGASGNYTVNSEGNAFFDKAGRNQFDGTFSITPNAAGYFSWGIRIYNPGYGEENHAVPISVQVSY